MKTTASTRKTTMRRMLITLLIFGCGGNTAFSADAGEAAATETPSRQALLKAAVARDRGEITAMEPTTGEGPGVIIGHSSGAVLSCYGEHTCREFFGTPNAAVEHIAVSRQGTSEVVWVSYPQGAIYRCARDRCEKFLWDGGQNR